MVVGVIFKMFGGGERKTTQRDSSIGSIKFVSRKSALLNLLRPSLSKNAKCLFS